MTKVPPRLMPFLVSNLRPSTTGVRGTVIWVSAGEFDEAHTQLGPRLKVMPGTGITPEGLADAATVTITDPPRVIGTLPGKLKERVVDFVNLNRGILLQYWSNEVSTREMIEGLAESEVGGEGGSLVVHGERRGTQAVAGAHDPDAVNRKILGRFQGKGSDKVGRSRGVLVLEPGLGPLAPALVDGNFTVVVADDLKGFERRRELLAARMVITRDAASFIDDAPVMEFGIVGLDALGSDIYVGLTLAESATAGMLATAFMEFDLALERAAYVLLLHPSGRHVFRRLS